MRRLVLVLVVLVLFPAVSLCSSGSKLKSNFENPSREYSLFPFWAWNATLEPEKLKWQIDQMVEKNVYGAFMHARIGINKGETPYFSDGWWEAIKTAATYGKEAGFYAWLYDEDKWPSGMAGGRTIAVNRQEYTQKGLAYSEMKIEGPQDVKLSKPEGLVAIIAAKVVSRGAIEPESLTDVSDFAGKQWAVPEGEWSILTFRQIADMEGKEGIDYLDKEAVATFIKITHEEYHRRFGEYFGNTIPGIFFDEMSARVPGADFAWTDDFLEQFEERKGYDLKKYLPALIYDADDMTPKIRCDYYDVFTSLYEEAWFKQIGEWCAEHNIDLTGHTYEDIFSFVTQGDYFRIFSHVQIPLTDNEEFRYSLPRYIEWFKPKQLASIAHLNDRKFAAVEALGGIGWSYTLEDLRYGVSMLSVYGINFMVLHGFFYTIDTPWTSADYPPSWFYQNPHWKYFGQVGKFMQRMSYMGTVGSHICDVAVLFPITSQWASGRHKEALGLGKKVTIEELDDILSLQYHNVQKALLNNQIDYDVVDPTSLRRADVSKGKIKIAKEKYPVLVLPPLSVVRRETIEKVKNFYDNGGTVIALNVLPAASMEAGKKDPVVINAVKYIFGINPLFVRSGYFEIDKTYTEKFITNTNENGGKAYFTKEVENVPLIVERAAGKDVIIEQGRPAGLRFLHRATKDYDIYHLMNEQKVPRKWAVSFRSTGKVEKWDPQTGESQEVYGITDGNGRTRVELSFGPWEYYYIVFNKNERQEHNLALGDTNLKDVKIIDVKKDKVTVEGLEPAGADFVYASVVEGSAKKQITEKRGSRNQLSEIVLSGQWDFVPVGDALDYKWQSEVKQSQIELPVMEFFPERQKSVEMKDLLAPPKEGIYWKQVKIKDTWSAARGCSRYLSVWDGWWITYIDARPHWGGMGGDKIQFRKDVNLGEKVKEAWISITGDKQYELFINGKEVGRGDDFKTAETYDISSYLRKGTNNFEVTVKETGALLVQGQVTLDSGKSITVVSDSSWDVCNETGIWKKAFEYVNPPLGAWGSIELKNQPLSFPVSVWYRQQLPTGAVGIVEPVIKGDYEIYVNGKTVEFKRGKKQAIFKDLLNDEKNILLIKVNVNSSEEGIIEPVKIICEPAKVELALWSGYGLDWYSGRCLYSKEFTIADEYLKPDNKLVLDPGDVKYFVEIWVNNKLVGSKIWPPYQVEIKDYLKPGVNTVNLVVANLLANKMKWNIFDDETLADSRRRWVLDIGLSQQPDRLDSGILGPVKIVPFVKRSLEISLLN